MNHFHSTDATLSSGERTRQIAELLVKAMLAAGARRAVPPVEEATPVLESEPVAYASSDDERIVRYLEVVGSAPPGIIREALGLPKTSAYRSFLRLTANGRIATVGRSRSIAYSLVVREPPADKLALN